MIVRRFFDIYLFIYLTSVITDCKYVFCYWDIVNWFCKIGKFLVMIYFVFGYFLAKMKDKIVVEVGLLYFYGIILRYCRYDNRILIDVYVLWN